MIETAISAVHLICHRRGATRPSSAISVEIINSDFKHFLSHSMSLWLSTNFPADIGTTPWFFVLFRLQQLEFSDRSDFLQGSHEVYVYTTTVKPRDDRKLAFSSRLLPMDALHLKLEKLVTVPVDQIPPVRFPGKQLLGNRYLP